MNSTNEEEEKKEEKDEKDEEKIKFTLVISKNLKRYLAKEAIDRELSLSELIYRVLVTSYGDYKKKKELRKLDILDLKRMEVMLTSNSLKLVSA
jgi:hypothetical protein